MTVEKESRNSPKRQKHKEQVPDDVGVPIPPDGGYGWVVLIASFFVSFIIDGCMYSFGIILDHIQQDFNVPQDRANLITSLNTGFLFMSGPAIAGFANQFGIRPLVMCASVIAACMYVVSAFCPNIYVMMVLFGFVGGISIGCTYLPSVLIIAMYFSEKRGIATGITMAGSGVGAFVFAPFTQFLLKMFDWRMTMVILGGIVIQCCVLGALMRPVPLTKKGAKKTLEMDDLKNKGSNILQEMSSKASLKQEGIDQDDFARPMYNKDAMYTRSVQSLAEFKKAGNPEDYVRSNISIPTIQEEEQSCCQRIHFFKVILDILKEMTNFKLLGQNKLFLLITVANFFVFIGYFLPFIYIPKRAKELGIENFAMLLSIIGIVNIPARILFGIVADRKIMSAFNLNTICFILCGIANFSYFLLINFWLQSGYSVLFAIGIAGMNCLTSVYLVELVGLDKLTNATGIISLFRGLGCFFGPFIGGFISEKLNSIVSAFFFASVCFAVGTLLVLLITLVKVINICRKKFSKKPRNEVMDKDTEAANELLNKA